MRQIILIALVITYCLPAWCQHAAKKATPVITPPVFNGCVETYLGHNLRYPDAARENDIEGSVTVQFVIDEKGTVQKAKLAGRRRVGAGCEEEALRVVRSMPAWKPAMYGKRPVKYVYTLPVTFRLE